ncbi:hypothetical protein EXIGLDRAFT_761503 [Exidia glandulosa HHB12029]|uniref:F-box domain-containing protein n=1 Tax=Exidia glandulosa HHB12029 TaxID=1314781 RepID=A0A165NG02_EXIGL|nr:hypothetical protein EXIGLDRAFT_761503 [Exidia glandulosa HHB12029]
MLSKLWTSSVLRTTLNHVRTDDLLVFGRVCIVWREALLSHQTFWDNISLSSMPPPLLHFLQTGTCRRQVQAVTYPALLQLPTEVLSMFIDFMSFEDLIHFGQVSHRTRAVSRQHHRFWHSVHLTDTSPRQLRRFLAQIGSSDNTRTVLDVNIAIKGCSAAVTNIVLPVIRQTLHRIRRMELYLHGALAQSLLLNLAVPAPSLTRILLSVDLSSCVDSEMPCLGLDLFAGCAPALFNVGLQHFRLPSHPLPAFAAVRFMELVCDASRGGQAVQLVSSHVVGCFPLVERMLFRGPDFAVNDVNGQDLFKQALHLKELHLQLRHRTSAFLHLLPDTGAALPLICATFPPSDVVAIFLQHMHGPIHLRIVRKRGAQRHVSVDIIDQRSGIVRRCQDVNDHSKPCTIPANVFKRTEWLADIVECTLFASVCMQDELLLRLPRLPNVKKVTFVLDSELQAKAVQGSLDFPSVQLLVLASRGTSSRRIRIADVATFARACFNCRALDRPEVRVEAVHPVVLV